MKINCDVIRDLLPLYVDDVLSETSKDMVKSHLETCTDCKTYFDQLSGNFDTEVLVSTMDTSATLKKIQGRISEKNKVIIFLVVVCLLVGSVIGYRYVMYHETPMPYKAGLVTIALEESGLKCDFLSDDLYTAYGYILGNDLYFYATSTPYTKGFQKEPRNNVTPIIRVNFAGKGFNTLGDVEKIYYVNTSLHVESGDRDITEKDYVEASKNAVLLWEK